MVIRAYREELTRSLTVACYKYIEKQADCQEFLCLSLTSFLLDITIETAREVRHPGSNRRRSKVGMPKGDLMEPMKIPARLLGMVFQIDK